MKNQWIRTSLTLALAIMMVAGINAQNRDGKGRGNYGNDRPGYGLDLTEEQEAQLKTLKLEHYKTIKPFRAEMGELKARKSTLMSQDVVDEKAVNKLIDQQTSLTNKLQKKQLTHTLAFREILSDEQLMKLNQKRKHTGKMNSRRGHKMCAPGQGRRTQM
jgi:Spy/CpxP family protein refolding chaperone